MSDLKTIGYLNWNKSFGDYFFHEEPRGNEPIHHEKRIPLTSLHEAQAQLAKYKEALTPSGNTKAEYIGEFTMDVTVTLGHEEETRRVTVPWTTIKDIMAAISKRAETNHD